MAIRCAICKMLFPRQELIDHHTKRDHQPGKHNQLEREGRDELAFETKTS